MKRTKSVAGGSQFSRVAGGILSDKGDHDSRMHHQPRAQMVCETCGAMAGQRCINLDILPTKANMRGFHAGRKAKARPVISWTRGYERVSGEMSSYAGHDTVYRAITDASRCLYGSTDSPDPVTKVWVRPVYAGGALGTTVWSEKEES